MQSNGAALLLLPFLPSLEERWDDPAQRKRGRRAAGRILCVSSAKESNQHLSQCYAKEADKNKWTGQRWHVDICSDLKTSVSKKISSTLEVDGILVILAGVH